MLNDLIKEKDNSATKAFELEQLQTKNVNLQQKVTELKN